MNLITTFGIHKEALLDLLRGIQLGRIQLPDFQRDWIWDNVQVCSLLSSVLLAYSVGGVILLQLGNPSARFALLNLISQVTGKQWSEAELPEEAMFPTDKLTSRDTQLIKAKLHRPHLRNGHAATNLTRRF